MYSGLSRSIIGVASLSGRGAHPSCTTTVQPATRSLCSLSLALRPSLLCQGENSPPHAAAGTRGSTGLPSLSTFSSRPAFAGGDFSSLLIRWRSFRVSSMYPSAIRTRWASPCERRDRAIIGARQDFVLDQGRLRLSDFFLISASPPFTLWIAAPISLSVNKEASTLRPVRRWEIRRHCWLSCD